MNVFTRRKTMATLPMKRMMFFCFMVFLSIHSYAQSHFTFSSNTGNNMTVLVAASISPNIHGESLETGDEIGVFNRNGLCVGAITWKNQTAAITVWGDNDQTTVVDGMEANDTLRFHIWDASKSKDFIAIVAFENESQCAYGANKIVKLRTLTVQSATIRSTEFFTAGKNELQSETVTIFDITGKMVARIDGIATEEGIIEKIKMNELPHGRYVAALRSKGKITIFTFNFTHMRPGK
jgi:hypothetical protein